LTAAKLHERFHRIAAAALLENACEKATCDVAVENALLLECAKRIRSEHFRPLVAVVTRCIAARENVLEAVREAIEGRGHDDSDVATHLVENATDRLCTVGRLAVNAQIE